MPEGADDGDSGARPSKTGRKRQMLALQALGEALTGLSDAELARLPLADERLLAAIRESRRIHSRGALRRHRQFIGKLMRDVDPAPIEEALQRLRQPARQEKQRFHRIERLRDEILAAGTDGVELAMVHFPGADRRELRQLLLQHRRETERGLPPAAARKLFRYLHDLEPG